MPNRAPRLARQIALFFVAPFVFVLLATITVAVEHAAIARERADRVQIHALIACVENTAYTRSLIGQCLDDYRESGRR